MVLVHYVNATARLPFWDEYGSRVKNICINYANEMGMSLLSIDRAIGL